MNNLKYLCLSSALALGLSACGGDDSSSTTSTTTPTPTATPTPTTTATPTPTTTATPTPSSSDITYFDPDRIASEGLSEDITIVDCTLSGGTETQCYQVVVTGVPVTQTVGPFCPPTLDSDASEGGIWFDGDNLYDIDGDFIQNLPTIYGDNNWVLYDADGNVNITDTLESCDGAAQPNVEEEYKYNCVECELSYIDGGGVSGTYLFPVTPVPLDSPDNVSGDDIGITLDGLPLSGSAPVDAILSNYTIAAFDDCGAHINLHQGYHYHGATDCLEKTIESDGHSALIGYAHDGYAIYALLDADGEEPSEPLDSCRGQTDEVRGYHYHTASTEENVFIGCYNGEQATITIDGPPGGPQ